MTDSHYANADPKRDARQTVAQELAAVAAAFVASRFLVFAAIYFSRLEIIRGPLWKPGSWFAVLTEADAATYLELARNLSAIASQPHDPAIACFPVYPLVVWAVALVVQNVALAGVLVANLCLLGAGWLLYRVVQMEFGDERVSRSSLMFLMFTPAGFFFSTATAESMLLLLSIGALLAARGGRWLTASVCGILAAGTMNLGLLLIVPLATELALQWRDATRAQRPFSWRPAMLLLVIPAMLVAALLTGSGRFSDSFALLRLSADSEATYTNLVNVSVTFAGYRSVYELILFGTVIAGLALGIAAFLMKLRTSYVVLGALLLVATAVSHDLEAPRTLAIAFPFFAVLGLLTRKFDASYEAVLLCSAGLLALFTILFANGHWMT